MSATRILRRARNCLTTQQMPYVASALKSILDEVGWTQRDLAENCGVPASQVNRYLRGVNRIPLESAQKLAAALPEEFRARFLVSYQRDCLPEEFEHLVDISPKGTRSKASAADEITLPADLDPELRRMIERFASLGMRHTQVRDMLASFLRLVDRPPER